MGAVEVGDAFPVGDEALEVGVGHLVGVFQQHRQHATDLIPATRVRRRFGDRLRLGDTQPALDDVVGEVGELDQQPRQLDPYPCLGFGPAAHRTTPPGDRRVAVVAERTGRGDRADPLGQFDFGVRSCQIGAPQQHRMVT